LCRKPLTPRARAGLFCAEEMPNVRAVASAIDKKRVLKQMWKDMSAEKRAPWAEKARLDKERFFHEMKRGERPPKRARQAEADKGERSEIATVFIDGVERNRPKQPTTGYGYFSTKYRRDHPERMSNAELGEIWRKMPQADKGPFLQQSHVAEERYKAELEEWFALLQTCLDDEEEDQQQQQQQQQLQHAEEGQDQ
jgi:hypothetical protein